MSRALESRLARLEKESGGLGDESDAALSARILHILVLGANQDEPHEPWFATTIRTLALEGGIEGAADDEVTTLWPRVKVMLEHEASDQTPISVEALVNAIGPLTVGQF